MSTHTRERNRTYPQKYLSLSLLFFLYYTTAAEPVLFIAYGFFSEREHAKSLSAAAAFVDFTLQEREYFSSALENKQHFRGNRSFESRALVSLLDVITHHLSPPVSERV
jgi:hypothetical protein